MLMFLNTGDFSINKGKLQIACRDNISIIIFTTKNCISCQKTKNALNTIPDIFPDISFGIVNLDTQPQLHEQLKETGIHINYTPTFMLFKLGVYIRHLDIPVLTKEFISRELIFELDKRNIIGYDESQSPYTQFGAM